MSPLFLKPFWFFLLLFPGSGSGTTISHLWNVSTSCLSPYHHSSAISLPSFSPADWYFLSKHMVPPTRFFKSFPKPLNKSKMLQCNFHHDLDFIYFIYLTNRAHSAPPPWRNSVGPIIVFSASCMFGSSLNQIWQVTFVEEYMEKPITYL